MDCVLAYDREGQGIGVIEIRNRCVTLVLYPRGCAPPERVPMDDRAAAEAELVRRGAVEFEGDAE